MIAKDKHCPFGCEEKKQVVNLLIDVFKIFNDNFMKIQDQFFSFFIQTFDYLEPPPQAIRIDYLLCRVASVMFKNRIKFVLVDFNSKNADIEFKKQIIRVCKNLKYQNSNLLKKYANMYKDKYDLVIKNYISTNSYPEYSVSDLRGFRNIPFHFFICVLLNQKVI